MGRSLLYFLYRLRVPKILSMHIRSGKYGDNDYRNGSHAHVYRTRHSRNLFVSFAQSRTHQLNKCTVLLCKFVMTLKITLANFYIVQRFFILPCFFYGSAPYSASLHCTACIEVYHNNTICPYNFKFSYNLYH